MEYHNQNSNIAQEKIVLFVCLGLSLFGYFNLTLNISNFFTENVIPLRWYYQNICIVIFSCILSSQKLFRKESDSFVPLLFRALLLILLIYPLPDKFFLLFPLVFAITFEASIYLTCLKKIGVLTTLLSGIISTLHPVIAWDFPLEPNPPSLVRTLIYLCIFTFIIGSLLQKSYQMALKNKQYYETIVTSSNELVKVNTKLQEYSMEVEKETLVSERRRITRELHDSVGYTLLNHITLMEVALRLSNKIQSENKFYKSNDDFYELVELLELSKSQARDNLNDVRRSLHHLRDDKTPSSNGTVRIKKLIAAFKNTQVKVEIEYSNVNSVEFGYEIDQIFFRTIQEGITNALRHGNATHIRIMIWKTNSYVGVTINDNGLGSSHIVKGIGLSGISERLLKLEGNLKATSKQNGFELEVRIPWNKTTIRSQ